MISVVGDQPSDPVAGAARTSLKLTVVSPVYNERHVVETSLRRVLALSSEMISELELIVVDDCSTDGTSEVLARLAAEDKRIRLFRQEKNQGKGAALKVGFEHATGDVTVVHDADLEYNPGDIPSLLVPFLREGADAVIGSRYLAAPYRRALMYRHTLMNKGLTALSNWLTDLNLTDMETCYKAVRTRLLQSIPIRSNDFRFEVEIVAKLAKRRALIFEVPIRYLPRSYEEGKKIRAKDGVLALAAMLRYKLVDDIYKEDEYGSRILREMEHVRRFTLWTGSVLRPWIGDRVLEIGAGIGTLTNQFIPRDRYLASDINPQYLDYLRSYAMGKPYLGVAKIDAADPKDFEGLDGQFDTAVMVNVLEHVKDPLAALRNLHGVLQPGGRAVILVPQHPKLFGTLDQVLEHQLRYTPDLLKKQLEETGFRVETMFDHNRVAVPGWWVNGKILRKRSFSRFQLKILDALCPLLRRTDRLLPWSGLSVIGVGVKI